MSRLTHALKCREHPLWATARFNVYTNTRPGCSVLCRLEDGRVGDAHGTSQIVAQAEAFQNAIAGPVVEVKPTKDLVVGDGAVAKCGLTYNAPSGNVPEVAD